MKSYKNFSIIELILTSLIPLLANAQPSGIQPTITYTPSAITNFPTLWAQGLLLISWFAGFIMAVAIIMILWAGFKFMTAGGDEEEVTKARHMLTYGIVGMVVAILAYTLPQIIRSIF